MKLKRTVSQQGFTLLELMASMIAALFVILAALLLSRNSMRAFADETHVSSTQLSARVGLDALAADLARAGFMATPNVKTDPNVCPKPAANTVHLQSIFYEPGADLNGTMGAGEPTWSFNQKLSPDRITIGANFATTDAYLISAVSTGVAGCAATAVVLQPPSANNTAIARLLTVTNGLGKGLDDVFQAGRLLRIQSQLGSSQYVLIAKVIPPNGANLSVTICLAPTPVFVRSAATQNNAACGAQGFCSGCLANPVTSMRYSIQSLASDANYAWAYPATGTPGDAVKYDLVREEMDPTGALIKGTSFIVAEYAVDIGFSFTVDNGLAPTAIQPWNGEPILVPYTWGDPMNKTIADDVTSAMATTPPIPQRIRSVFVRLTTRTRDVDRSGAVDDGGPFLSRYMIPINGAASNQYARARTLTQEVALINLRGVRWQ